MLGLIFLLRSGGRLFTEERVLSATKTTESSGMRFREVLGRIMCAKERNLRMDIHSALNLAYDLKFVAGLLLENERSIVS